MKSVNRLINSVHLKWLALLGGVLLGAAAVSAEILLMVAQSGEVGQELKRLGRDLRDAQPTVVDREMPPQAAIELKKRAAELEERIDAEAAQIERDAAAILEEAEEAMKGSPEAAEEAADAVDEATDEAVEAMDEVLEEGEAVTEVIKEEAEEAVADADAAKAAAEAVIAGGEAEAEAETLVEAETEEEPDAENVAEADAEKVEAEDVVEAEAEVEVEEEEEAEEEEEEEVEAEEEKVAASEEPEEEKPAARTSRRSSRRGASHKIETVVVEGDVDLLEQLGLLEQLKLEVVGQTLKEQDIRDVARRYNKMLVEEGLYLSRISMPPLARRRLAEGELLLEVDQGRVGETAFYQKEGTNRVDYAGKWYSEKQLRRRLSGLETDAPFLYDDFYKSVFTVNSHPDLTMDTDLKVRQERVDGHLRRYVDMDFVVEDEIPIHAVLEFQNSGTEATEEWRAALTVQHLNLTKHDDVLTLTLPASLDFSTVRSIAGSYYVPHYIKNGGAFTFYAGYSELDTEDLVPDIDLEGTGYFVGAQASYDLIESDRHSVKLSLGWAYQLIEDTLILGADLNTPREVTIAPVSFVVSYSSVRPDRFAGRNFLTSQTSVNFGLGSDDEEMSLQRETAESDYWVERLQFARIQPLKIAEPDPEQQVKQWIAFLKLEGQYASGALIPAEAKAVGGLDNVRGYEEREVLGDNGISGTLELRSPILVGDLTSRLGTTPDAAGGSERLQMVGFVDFAYMTVEDTLQDQEDTFELLSVGLGIRAAVTRFTQLKLDWGFPIEETEESDSGGRGHISFEVQI